MNIEKRKCGIVTFHSSHNYGSVLQSYALVITLRKMGLDAEIIDFRHPHTTDMYEWRLWSPYKNWRWNLKDILLKGILHRGYKRQKAFSLFIENVLPKSRKVHNCEDAPSDYDILVCGSDQIWNPVSTGENDPMYFLQFGQASCKFSYAASSGSSRFGDECHEKMEKWLQSLNSIGVREQFLKEYIESEFNLPATVNPDPTILLPSTDWEQIEEPYKALPKKYLLVYSLTKTEKTAEFAAEVGRQRQLPTVMICYEPGQAAAKKINFALDDVSPQQFLWLFHHASFIITNTFHGNMFSIIFRKEFVEYCKWKKEDPRVATLHNAIGLGKSRHVKEADDVRTLLPIEYNENKIDEFRNSGLIFLKENLN